jgi:hypothetical protein
VSDEEVVMYQTVEAVVKNGIIQPIEAIEYEENTRFLLVRLTPQPELIVNTGFKSARGAFVGRVSTVDEFIAQKAQEKSLEL